VIGSGQDTCVVNTNKMKMIGHENALVGRCLIANAGIDRNKVLMKNQMRHYHQQLYTFKITPTGRRKNKFEIKPPPPQKGNNAEMPSRTTDNTKEK
jgi:hypothetical protein